MFCLARFRRYYENFQKLSDGHFFEFLSFILLLELLESCYMYAQNIFSSQLGVLSYRVLFIYYLTCGILFKISVHSANRTHELSFDLEFFSEFQLTLHIQKRCSLNLVVLKERSSSASETASFRFISDHYFFCMHRIRVFFACIKSLSSAYILDWFWGDFSRLMMIINLSHTLNFQARATSYNSYTTIRR